MTTQVMPLGVYHHFMGFTLMLLRIQEIILCKHAMFLTLLVKDQGSIPKKRLHVKLNIMMNVKHLLTPLVRISQRELYQLFCYFLLFVVLFIVREEMKSLKLFLTHQALFKGY